MLRPMFIPGALRGLEASSLADARFRKLRTAIFKVVLSRRQPLVSVSAVLGVQDGPQGCDPSYCVVWFRMLRMLRRYLAYWPGEERRVYRLLDRVSEGCPGHGPVRLLVDSATEIGFQWDSRLLGWERPGLPVLSNLAGPFQHFKAAVLDAWRSKVAAALCERKGCSGWPVSGCEMKDWVLSQEGDRWSVKFDVWDPGGHLDTTFEDGLPPWLPGLVWLLLGWFLSLLFS